MPSPSRMSRSRRGLAFIALSMASWPRSPERWEKTRAFVIEGSELIAAIAAAVAMKPSMMTRRFDLAADWMAADIIAISKPPYSVRAISALRGVGVRLADWVRTVSLCWTPESFRPVPGPTRSWSGMSRILWAMMDAEAVFAMPISPKQMASVEGEEKRLVPWDVACWNRSGVIAGPREKSAVPGAMRRFRRSGWSIGSPAIPASMSWIGMFREFAMTFAAAPPERRFRTICRVTSDGYADTPCPAIPWSAPKMMSWQVDMLGLSVPWSVAICAVSCSRRPREPMGLVLESRDCWMAVANVSGELVTLVVYEGISLMSDYCAFWSGSEDRRDGAMEVGVVVFVLGCWLFGFSRLGGHTPLAALAPLSQSERGWPPPPPRASPAVSLCSPAPPYAFGEGGG